MAATGAVVELRDVDLSFGDKEVLRSVSLVVGPQERLAIIGQSGAGKTTILRLVLGILEPTAGSVFFQQLEIPRLDSHELQRAGRESGWFTKMRPYSARAMCVITWRCRSKNSPAKLRRKSIYRR